MGPGIWSTTVTGWSRLATVAPMPGESGDVPRVKIMNANWCPGRDGAEGTFAVMVITDDDQRRILTASPSEMTALVALATADTVLAWDQTHQMLIAANIVGQMPWTTQDRP